MTSRKRKSRFVEYDDSEDYYSSSSSDEGDGDNAHRGALDDGFDDGAGKYWSFNPSANARLHNLGGFEDDDNGVNRLATMAMMASAAAADDLDDDVVPGNDDDSSNSSDNNYNTTTNNTKTDATSVVVLVSSDSDSSSHSGDADVPLGQARIMSTEYGSRQEAWQAVYDYALLDQGKSLKQCNHGKNGNRMVIVCKCDTCMFRVVFKTVRGTKNWRVVTSAVWKHSNCTSVAHASARQIAANPTMQNAVIANRAVPGAAVKTQAELTMGGTVSVASAYGL